MAMRASQVIAGLDKKDGGPFYTLPYLWRELSTLKVKIEVHTTLEENHGLEKGSVSLSPFRIRSYPRSFPSAFKYSRQFKEGFSESLSQTDLCHNYGVWLYPNWTAGTVARQMNKPLIITPLGHLEPWSLKHHGLQKKIVRWLLEKDNWNYCSAWIAKSDFEAEHLRQLGLRGEIVVIPNGLNVQEWSEPVSPQSFYQAYPHLEDFQLLVFLSRIDPKKGIQELLEVWRKLCDYHRDWHLVICGDHQSPYGKSLLAWVEAQGIKSRITFTGMLEGDSKRALLAAGDLFVLPSQNENFGQAILEALAAGLPVITTRECPWPGIEKHGCGFWIDAHVGHLDSSLRQALGLPEAKRIEMGKRGKAWVLKEFDWKLVAEKHRELYSKILGKS
jgi:glycosyltransferase involved in cell wall biosynthesis